MAIVTPAAAGPFDLGTVVVKTALHLDPETAQITAISDPIPQILQGIPLDVRSVQVRLDKPDFTLNPTSCDPMAVTGQLFSVLGSGRLPAEPLPGGGVRATRLQTEARPAPQGRHQARRPPSSESSADDAKRATPTSPRPQSPCRTRRSSTRPTSARSAPGSSSPPISAQPHRSTAKRPRPHPCSTTRSRPGLPAQLLQQAARPGRGAEWPRSPADRGGDSDGSTRPKAASATTFEAVPDAPVSKFVLEMQGGKKGLLINSRNLCKSVNKATALFDGQNGKVSDSEPVLKNDCKKKRRGKKHSR